MSLTDLASLGSFISGIAVLVSLVFLYFQLGQVTEQVKQAEKNQRASIGMARNTRIMEFTMGLTEPSTADAYSLGMIADKDMTDTQIRQFASICTGRFFNSQDSFYQHRQGLLEDYEIANMTKGLKQAMRSPGFRVVYKRSRGVFGDEFTAYLDRILEETQATLNADAVGSFRAELAAERALALGAGWS